MLEINSINYQIADKVILNGISYELREKEHVLIHGPSGCGKSTLMHIMAGLLPPTSGSVNFNGTIYDTLTNNQLDKLRGKNFGFIFQKMHLINHLTARQNIQLASKQFPESEIIDDLGISLILDQKVSSLSVGEAQRVALARALANKPRVIFADEPTSALDKINADKVMELLFSKAEKYDASLVVTSHDERIQSYFKNKLSLHHE